MQFQDLRKQIMTPPVLAEKDQFLIKFAENEEEVERALRLRFEIFNLEQGKGLDSANSTGIDRDEFDEHCLHLVVVDKSSDKPVGTYRIHLGPIACSNLGFYSANEFEITGMDEIAEQSIEVGRSCVSPGYRTGAVVALLWSGISELLYRSRLTYLFGCVSLETTAPAVGWALHRYFVNNDKISDLVQGIPRDKFLLPRPPESEIANFFGDRRELIRSIPPVFKGYLRLGAKICGDPVLDQEFGTIDFLIILDTSNLPERYMRHFNVDKESS